MEENNKYKGLFYNGHDDNIISETKKNLNTDNAKEENIKTNREVSYTLPDGNKYEGMEKNNKRNGQGTFIWKNGDKYVGEFKDNKHNGQGTLIWENGDKYVGEFKDGLRHGQGTYIWGNGDKYVGEYKDNKQNGQGTYIWESGNKYEGLFKDNLKHGQGTLIGKDGDKYVGEFKDDLRHGQGTFIWKNGDKYVGEFKEDKHNGQGTLIEKNGDKYVGEFKDNLKHGFGIYTWSDGMQSQGEWKYGFMIDAPGSFGYQYRNLITKMKNDPPLPNQKNLIFYIEPIKIATLFGQFLSLTQKLFSLKKSDYDDFVIFFFDFSVRAYAILKILADEAHKEKKTNKDADKLSKMEADIFNRCAVQIFHLGRTIVMENKQVFNKNSYKLYDKYHLEYKNRDGVIEKTLNPIEIVYEEWEKAYTSTSRVTRAHSREDLTDQSSILKKEVVQNLIKKDKDTASPGILLIFDYLEGKVSKQGYRWEAFVDLFLKKYWDKMYKNKANKK